MALSDNQPWSLEDLLPRPVVGLDQGPLQLLIRHQRVMVTGAGGSIGSELCRQIAAIRPAGLILYERYENNLYSVLNDVLDDDPSADVHPCVGDVTDRRRLNEVLAQHRPNVVFHAAAHKHVPLMEVNPCEAVKNNVRGTRRLAEAAERHGVDRFIMISTDKAVNPTSVMGATKRVCELILRHRPTASRTSFSLVRFGNVLGSSGSVVLRFVDQIKGGGPVTVTHPDIKRYFMLLSEAVELVLHAAAESNPSTTYVLDMGEQIKLVDLAQNLIRLLGHTPAEIPIMFTGLRPGEKMYEELVGAGETATASGLEGILRVSSECSVEPRALGAAVAALEQAADDGQAADVLDLLREIEPSYCSAPTPERPTAEDSTALFLEPADL